VRAVSATRTATDPNSTARPDTTALSPTCKPRRGAGAYGRSWTTIPQYGNSIAGGAAGRRAARSALRRRSGELRHVTRLALPGGPSQEEHPGTGGDAPLATGKIPSTSERGGSPQCHSECHCPTPGLPVAGARRPAPSSRGVLRSDPILDETRFGVVAMERSLRLVVGEPHGRSARAPARRSTRDGIHRALACS
jgi:hypothetical protein